MVYSSMHWGRHYPGQTPTLPPQADTLRQTLPRADTPLCIPACIGADPLPDGHYSGRYASYWNADLFTLKATSEIAAKTPIGLILILKIWRTLISPFMGPLFRYTVTSTMGSKEVSFLEIYQMYFVRLDEFM